MPCARMAIPLRSISTGESYDTKKCMSLILKIHWVIWIFLFLVISLGTFAFHISPSSPEVTLQLTKGEKADFSFFRIFPDTLGITLFHHREPGDQRFELGVWNPQRTEENDGFQYFFQNPGAPLKLLVQEGNQEKKYEAWPSSGHGEKIITRGIVPHVEDNDPQLFHISKANQLRLSPGNIILKISVLEVDKRLQGERVKIYIEPPVSFKFQRLDNYRYLWWFNFWPIYVFLLIIYGCLLLFLGRQNLPHYNNQI